MIRFMMILGIVPWPLNADLTGYWTMWGTVATAIGTVGLVVVAWFAWRAALGTLRGQQTASEVAALKDYMSALHALALLSLRTPPEFMPAESNGGFRNLNLGGVEARRRYVMTMTHEVEITSSIWRAFHHETMKGSQAFFDAQELLVTAQGWRLDPPAGTEDSAIDQFKLNAEFAKEIAFIAMRWQVSVGDREFLSAHMDTACDKFVERSPCLPPPNEVAST